MFLLFLLCFGSSPLFFAHVCVVRSTAPLKLDGHLAGSLDFSFLGASQGSAATKAGPPFVASGHGPLVAGLDLFFLTRFAA